MFKMCIFGPERLQKIQRRHLLGFVRTIVSVLLCVWVVTAGC